MEPENKGGDIVAPQIPLQYPARKTTEPEPVRGTAPLPPRTQWETRGLPSLNATFRKDHTTPQTSDERTPSRDPPLNLTASCGHPQPPSWDLYYSHTINLYIYLLQSRR